MHKRATGLTIDLDYVIGQMRTLHCSIVLPLRKRIFVLICVSVSIHACAMTTHGADENMVQSILNAIPLNAQAAIVIPDPGKLTGDMKERFRQFKSDLNVKNGLDEERPLIVIVRDIRKLWDTAPQMLLLASVSDYNEFIQNFDILDENKKPLILDDMAFSLKYANKVGDFAVLGSVKKEVEKYSIPNTSMEWLERIGEMGKQALEKSDISLIIDPTPFAELLNKGMSTITSGKLDSSDSLEDKAAQVLTPQFKKFLRDVTCVVIGFDQIDSGIHINCAAHLKDNSELLPDVKNVVDVTDQLQSLPEKPYVLALACSAIPNSKCIPLGYLFGIDMDFPLINNTQVGSAVIYLPSFGHHNIEAAIRLRTNNPSPTMEGLKSQLDELTRSWKKELSDAGVIKIEDLEFKKYKIHTMGDPKHPDDNEEVPFGPYHAYLGKKDNEVIIALSQDKAFVKEVLDAKTNKEGLGSGGHIETLRQEMRGSKSRLIFEAYINMGILKGAPAMEGVPNDKQASSDLPLLAYLVSVSEQEYAFQWYVPSNTFRFIRNSLPWGQ